jgi:hypothetical protein
MGAGDLEIWLNHFEHHARHPRCVAHGLSDVLRPDERELIASSIATFQLGEQSEGRTLLRAAESFARERQVPHLLRIFELLSSLPNHRFRRTRPCRIRVPVAIHAANGARPLVAGPDAVCSSDVLRRYRGGGVVDAPLRIAQSGA